MTVATGRKRSASVSVEQVAEATVATMLQRIKDGQVLPSEELVEMMVASARRTSASFHLGVSEQRRLDDVVRIKVRQALAGFTLATVASPVLAESPFRDVVQRHRAKMKRLAEESGVPLKDRRAHILDVVRAAVVPPLTSAQNVEVAAMSYVVFQDALEANFWPWTPLDADSDLQATAAADRRQVLAMMDRTDALFNRLGLSSDILYGTIGVEDQIERTGFLPLWRDSGFARLEVSHKLAAALCLTDAAPEQDSRAPWTAWSLLVPDGLLGRDAARVWCADTEPCLVVRADGTARVWEVVRKEDPVLAEVLRNLVVSACIVMTTPEHVRGEGRWGSAGIHGKPRRCGPPPDGARYIMAHPVVIDLREKLLEVVHGKRRGGVPTVQFLVRGHFTNQPYGPKGSLRRRQWVEPYWKGNPEARVLLRSHKIKEEKE